MPKFYVWTGDSQEIVDAHDIDAGIRAGLRKIVDADADALGELVAISEKGFDDYGTDTRVMLTEMLLEELGLIEGFTDDEG